MATPPQFNAQSVIDDATRRFMAMPIATRTLLALVTLVNILSAVYAPLQHYCLHHNTVSAASMLLSPLLHGSLLHYLFNMLALVETGRDIEGHVGTMGFTGLIGVLWVGTEGCYLLLQSALAAHGTELGCVLGFSGIIFGLIAFDCYAVHVNREHSLCGIMTFPSSVFPIALLVFCLLLFPGSSFAGHAIGVALGALIAWKMPDSFWECLQSTAPFRWRDADLYRTRTPRMVSGRLQQMENGGIPALPVVSDVGNLVAGEKNFKPFSGQGRTLGSTDGSAPPASAGTGSTAMV